jgi:hypothetical protein
MLKSLQRFFKEFGFLGGLVMFALLAVFATYPGEPLKQLGFLSTPQLTEFSGLAAFFLYAFSGLLVWRMATYFLFPKLSLSKIIERLTDSEKAVLLGKIILAIALIVLGATVHAQTPAQTAANKLPHIAIAEKYVGVTEKPRNSNRGPEVETFLKFVGLGGGYSYCAAFVSFVLDKSGACYPAVNGKLVKTAAARGFVIPGSIPAEKVLRGEYKLQGGEVVVWRRGESWQGHVGFVTKRISDASFTTIEANTSPGTKGSQANGGGIYARSRTIVPTSHFRIIAFTPVKYKCKNT